MRTHEPILAAALAIVVLSGCTKANTCPVESGARQVGAVHIAGNDHVDEDDLVSGLEAKPRGYFPREYACLDSYILEQDRARIETYYRSRGYFSARVVSIEPDGTKPAEDGEQKATVTFEVDEGRPSILEDVSVRVEPEDSGLKVAQLESLIGLTRGQPFVHGEYLEAKRRLAKHLSIAGYAHARVTGAVRVHPEDRRVVVRFEVDAARKTRFGATTVNGLTTIPESAVRSRIAWREGDVYDPRKVEITKARLHALGAFSVVRIDVAPRGQGAPAPAEATMQITVAEALKRGVRLGGGVAIDSTVLQVRGRAGYNVLGFGHPLNSLSLEARPALAHVRGVGGDRAFVAEASATLRREDLWLPLVTAVANVSYALQEVEAYTSQGPSTQLSVNRPLADSRVNLGLGWRFRVLQFLSVDDAIPEGSELARRLGLDDVYRLGVFEQSLVWDGRDRPLDPRFGHYFELRLEQGGAFAGGEFRYGLVTPELRGYASLGERITFGARVRAGIALWGEVPITRRYFSGGATRHRGFGQRRLSPIAVVNDGEMSIKEVGIGGEASLQSSIEARIDLVRLAAQWLGIVVFADYGDVTLEPAELDLLDLHLAVGSGIRYSTVVGALRFDVGYRVNRIGQTEPDAGERWSFHLALGEAF